MPHINQIDFPVFRPFNFSLFALSSKPCYICTWTTLWDESESALEKERERRDDDQNGVATTTTLCFLSVCLSCAFVIWKSPPENIILPFFPVILSTFTWVPLSLSLSLTLLLILGQSRSGQYSGVWLATTIFFPASTNKFLPSTWPWFLETRKKKIYCFPLYLPIHVCFVCVCKVQDHYHF